MHNAFAPLLCPNFKFVNDLKNNTANDEYLKCAFPNFTQDSMFSPYLSNSITIDHLRLCCCSTVKITAVDSVLAVDGTQNFF